MKLISFAVPCYNSQAYMDKCIKSLLVGGDDVEIIIIDDGSKDATAEIADGYARDYPDAVRVVHKPNGGHGSGVNRGLKEATGLYYKVVDSDDWLDEDSLKLVIKTIKSHVEGGVEADMYITNFVYEKVYDGTRYVSEYVKQMPADRFFGWNQTKPLKLWKMLLMHAIIYKTERVRESGVILPEHTFYVDNLYAYQPLPYMHRLYYINTDLYRYYIGRSDQSVMRSNMIGRYSQQMKVMNCMLQAYTYQQIKGFDRRLRKLVFHILEVIMLNTIFFTTAADDEERRAAYKKMWSDLKVRDKKLYKKLKYHTAVKYLNILSWRSKGRVTTKGYNFLCKHVKLGV